MTARGRGAVLGISQGYAFFAYPWMRHGTGKAYSPPCSHAFQGAAVFGFRQTGVALAPARLTPANFLTRLRRGQMAKLDGRSMTPLQQPIRCFVSLDFLS